MISSYTIRIYNTYIQCIYTILFLIYLFMCVDLHDHAAVDLVHSLIDSSIDNWTTTCYDRYQRWCVGIF